MPDANTPGTDTYSGAPIAFGSWSDTVGYTPASAGAPATVQVGGFGAQTVTLDGSVDAAGQSVTLTIDSSGQSVQQQLQSVCDIAGGSVFTDAAGDTYVFSDGALTQGAIYAAVAGFGAFDQGPPQPACFAAGTRIETRDGPAPVEALRPGDMVRAVLRAGRGGGWAPVVWTGQRSVDCGRHPAPHQVWPVRVAAGAFGPGRPSRDLFLSPDHAVFDHGALIPVRLLLNDATVTAHPVREVNYWHVELPRHDVLLAEGLPVESYLDTGNRDSFGAPGRVIPLASRQQPDHAGRAWRERGWAPLLLDDAALAPARRRLREHARIAGWTETADAALELRVGVGVGVGGGARLHGARDGVATASMVPAGATRLHLTSRGVVPLMLGGGNPDGRRLGVAVTRIRLDGREVRLDDPRLNQGWHAMESGWRWTDGAAVIPLTASRTARRIEILTAPMLPYWQPPGRGEPARQAA